MIGATFCSGIGAPEMAAPWVDWRLASEIEPFPRAVLQERFGYRAADDHNQGDPLLWGDMTEITPDLMRERGIPLPDLIVAGTPCQDFSVAGLRAGLNGDRGNLTLTFVELLHAIVAARPDGKLAVLWENVPGVLSDSGNAFGCFLGGVVGAVDALQPPGDGSWPGEGMVQGPRARAAWAVLDAQWFGVAQRRRRVFVVIDFGGAVDPAAVLLEPDRLRGDSAPRREAGQRPAPTLAARTNGGGGLGTDFDCDGGLIASETAHCLQTTCDDYSRADGFNMVAHSLTAGMAKSASRVPQEQGALIPVAFDCKGTEVQSDVSGGETPLRSMGHVTSHQNAGGHAAVAFAENSRAELRLCGGDGQISAQLTTGGGKPGQGQPCVAEPWAVRRLTPTECHRLQGFPDDHCAITYRKKAAADGPQYKALGNSMAVPCVAWILDRIKISHEQMRRAA
ncbi:DNA cytosine methyltransferase [Phaeobacter gallaeciensis]|uniref:DNA cytosine methyltransferase n=1 Tax=Phaeobacter gallaeciensis TaxID=60890 RepID=UPI00237F0DF1|nr:DNA cytosine methyltransferase [Phaeobacter gallaeciensis]MDE4303597.1 DNA cytosine methyltransferase [Phaeobacter gallaeciensis]MDE4307921.1 DNA cytosine methyltransferase [Phaeobacter gallaeciensis]MDE4312379.1 DNA cytosine methyltransferase [Phaeobacter gallaeciensis]MDE4316850.1 DNA cytosine methyltransferase [Phaeobacter gallaeciensis]MDE4321313.1 DNA cytosine methyltransferase [Phaeobacter gallaeciensis]